MLGYLCAYYRYYYPFEFITSFLNNAANDEDIQNGTSMANRYGISVTMPKWGLSRSDYFFDKDSNIIAKGLSSIKFMSKAVADELYDLSRTKSYSSFIELLKDIDKYTSLDSRQLDILIKIDFFSQFGNQRTLFVIADMYNNVFKKGSAKKILKTKIEGTAIEPAVKKYAIGETKAGAISKSYTLLDIDSIMVEAEEAVKALNLPDLEDFLKVRNFEQAMGYVGYISGKEEDRRKLYILDIYPLKRKRDGAQFGYSIITKSLGSGKESRFTLFNRVFNNAPISRGNMIYCKSFVKDGQYFVLDGYDIIA